MGITDINEYANRYQEGAKMLQASAYTPEQMKRMEEEKAKAELAYRAQRNMATAVQVLHLLQFGPTPNHGQLLGVCGHDNSDLANNIKQLCIEQLSAIVKN